MKLIGHTGQLVTHGIDVYSPPDDPNAVFIFVVNHLPNPLHYQTDSAGSALLDKAQSVVEIFRHTLGSDSAEHVWSVDHPSIRTPNDIYATSPTSFYITNDHHYREGRMREIEDLLNHQTAAWSDIVHVEISEKRAQDGSTIIEATTALTGLHNPNGLGHGAHPDDVLVVDASGGVLIFAQRKPDDHASRNLTILDHIQLDSTLDNPSYYHDAYATAANNASGYILAGLARAADLLKASDDPNTPIPVMVWHVRSTSESRKWEKKLIFQDDGKQIRSASAAVLVGIDPKGNGGKKQAWLFVTGFLSNAMVASKVDL